MHQDGEQIAYDDCIPWHVWYGGWKNVPPSIRAREQRELARFNTARRIKRRAELARRKVR